MSLLLNAIAGFICLVASEPGTISENQDVRGYRDIIFYSEKYVAAGTEGRIDYISRSGEREALAGPNRNNLNSITCDGLVIVIAGDNGTILYSSDGKVFSSVSSGTNSNINGIIFKNGLFVAGADGGLILLSQNGSSWSSVKTGARGNIVSVSANDSFFIGVTDRGEILTSKNGIDWIIMDYNKEYSGYNKSCVFKKVLATNNRIVIAGKHDDNTPAVLFSTLGNVWTERTLIYEDNEGTMQFLANEPNAITYDSVRDQFILACDKGEVFTLPSCAKCNGSAIISDSDLYAIICRGNLLISVGRDFSVNILNL